MNKYDVKINEIAPEASTIHELICRPVRSPFFQFVNIIFDSIPWVVDGIAASQGAYYLIINESKADLVHMERNLDLSQSNVTSAVQKSANKRSFEFEGNKYKLYRKIK